MTRERIDFISNKENLLKEIWEEKREKVLGKSPPDTLFIATESTNIAVGQILSKTLDTLSQDPLRSYEWAKHWGRTTVAIHPNKRFSFEFLNRFSPEAKAYIPVNTTQLISPSEYVDEANSDGKYFILLNNNRCTLEGLVLQSERMLDELIWCVHLREANTGIPKEIAYSNALNEVNQKGFDYIFLEENEILNLRAYDPRYAVRIYGNINHKGKVSSIIGAVGPVDGKIEKPISQYKSLSFPRKITEIINTNDSIVSKKPEHFNINDCFIGLGISIAKKPHLGHLLLAGLAETARRTSNIELPIVIEGNDIGPRIIKSIAYSSDELSKTPSEIINMVNDGVISVDDFEGYYKLRDLASKDKIIDTLEVFKTKKLNLYQQGNSTIEVFRKFFKNNLYLIHESSLDSEIAESLNIKEKGWNDSGFGFLRENKQIILLENNGIPTAPAIRAAFILKAKRMVNKSEVIYIDADPSIKQSLNILKRHQDETPGVQFSGAGIGFNFELASGTKGDSISIESFLHIYESLFPQGDITTDIIYLVNTRYQLQRNDGTTLSFLDYFNQNAFLTDIQQIRQEKDNYLQEIQNLKQKITTLSSLDKTGFGKSTSYVARRASYLLKTVSVLADSDGDIRPSNIFLKPDELDEDPKIKSLIDSKKNEGLSIQEARKFVLHDIVIKGRDEESSLIRELKLHGYQKDDLLEAIDKIIEKNLILTRPRNILFSTISSIRYITDMAESLEIESSSKLLKALNICQERLFKGNK